MCAEIRYRVDTSVPSGTVSEIKEYDTEGRMILNKVYKYDDPETISTWTINEYSEDGKNRTTITCDSNGNPVSRETSIADYSEYDVEGNLICTFESNSTGGYNETNYDTNGNVISVIGWFRDDDGSMSKGYELEYEYDEHNNLIKETEINSNDRVVSWYEYTYGKYTVVE